MFSWTGTYNDLYIYIYTIFEKWKLASIWWHDIIRYNFWKKYICKPVAGPYR